jgi:two-component system, chemotaxis family, CheB/CheR fusion protein
MPNSKVDPEQGSQVEPTAQRSSAVASPPAESPAPSQPGQPAPSIVAIGASAGGIKALQSFFAALPADTGMIFVVILHLSPEHESALAELLQHHTTMRVLQVTRQVTMEPDHVYVIPPARQLSVEDGVLTVADFDEPRGQRAPIDYFLRALAKQHSETAAILLSGTGADGSLGIKAIKEGGGLLLVQDPQEAEYDNMPRNALATGLVDVVAPVRQLVEELVVYQQNKETVQRATEPDALSDEGEDKLQRILAYLRVKVGHDFNQYKRPTVLRRIRRRMQLTHTSDLAEYLQLVRQEEDEAQLLFQDLLIGVTSFFRDPEAFQSLEKQVLPNLIADKGGSDTIRVWSVGCATGEEAYSLAMLLLEQTGSQEDSPAIQIFATDLDEQALEMARQGTYPETIAADLTEERLNRFFIKQEGHYRIRAEVREQVLFAPHNLLSDPPFSRLDLICCRNLLIYLQRELQEKVLEIFYYALRPDGCLFLGTAESAEGASELFESVNKKQRLYRRRARVGAPPVLPTLPLTPSRLTPAPSRPVAPASPRRLDGEIHREMLEAYAPPSALVDEDFTVLHLSDTVGRYLLHPGGVLTHDIIKLVRPELQVELRAALYHSFEQQRAIVTRPLHIQFNGTPSVVYLTVRPHPVEDGKRLALVLFIEDESKTGNEALLEQNEAVQRLEVELKQAYDRLQSMREEHETSEEELKASNEELQSINEEYKSTLEELETGKEELKSINEELQTINQELKNKVEEVSQAHSDLQNLFAATEIATLFLDRELRIKRYTPRISELIDVMPGDRGRPVTHLKPKMNYVTLEDDAKAVLQHLTPVEREVLNDEGRSFLVRMRPYRTVEDRINGVVLTFVDITQRKQMEDELQLAKEYAESIVDSVREPLLVLESTLHIRSANESFYHFFHTQPEETVGRPFFELGAGQWNLPELRHLLEQVLPADKPFHDFEVEDEFPELGRRTFLLYARRLDHVQLILLAIEDITERKQTQMLRALNTELAHRNQELHLFTHVASHDLKAPLRGIRQLITWIAEDNATLLPEASQKHLALLHARMAQMDALIDDLLAYARAGREHYPPDRVEMTTLIKEILSLLSVPAGFSVQLHEPLPTLLAERVPLAAVFRNLLDNAFKHHQQPSAGIVQIAAEEQSDLIRFTVADNGPGVDPRYHEQIFQMFQTLTPPNPGDEGGVGLALVKRIVESRGGAIWVESTVGQGATFCFTWPKRPPL